MKITAVGQYIQILLYTIPTVFATIFSVYGFILGIFYRFNSKFTEKHLTNKLHLHIIIA